MTRINRYEGSCHKSRAHVSIVTRTRINRYEPPMMVAGDAHWPITTSTRPISTSIPPDNDIDTVRCAWAMIVAGGANHPSAYAMYGYKSRKGVAPFHGFALCVKSWCRIFPRTISGLSDTNLSAAPAHGRLKRSKIKKEKPNKGLSPILSKGRKATISPISTISKGKERLLTD